MVFDRLVPPPGATGPDDADSRDDNMPGALEDDVEMTVARNEHIEVQRVGVGRGSGQCCRFTPSPEPRASLPAAAGISLALLCLPEHAPDEGVHAAGASPCRGPQSPPQGRGAQSWGVSVHMGHCGKPRDIPALSAVLHAALVPTVG